MSDLTPAPDAPSKPPMRFRRTRIAVSVFFALMTVALCVLWVRSYYRANVLYGNLPGLGGFEIESREGNLYLLSGPINRPWGIGSSSTSDRRTRIEILRQLNVQKGGHGINQLLRLGHGLLAVIAGLIFALFQITHLPHFSLRSLLIATTLVAVVLGLILWAKQETVGSPQWWARHKPNAEYHVGKGYRVKGFDGYFDGKGQPIRSKLP